MRWSEEKVVYLQEQRRRGITFQRIADNLGFTKNACIGRFHFLERAKNDNQLVVTDRKMPYLHELTTWKFVRDNPRNW